MKNFLYNPFVVATALFLLSVLIVNPIGEFAVNDDWAYFRQVESSANLGNYRISSYIDPAFIAQEVIGVFWGKIFGVTFTGLRLLTLVLTVLLGFGIYKILSSFTVSKPFALLTLLLVYFNPLLYTSAMSFMTEIYFMTPLLFATYFYLVFLDTHKYKTLLPALVLGGLSVLVRQYGVAFFLVVFITTFLSQGSRRDKSRTFLAGVVVLLLCFTVITLWPRYSETGNTSSIAGISALLSNLTSAVRLPAKLMAMALSLPYFSFFALPLGLSLQRKTRLAVRILQVVCAVGLGVLLYTVDIFPVGSVFYLEGLYAKSDYRSTFSLFNNVPVKMALSFISGYALSLFLVSAFEARATVLKAVKANQKLFVLLLLSALLFVFLLIGSDYYDRYLLPPLVFFSIFMAVLAKNMPMPKSAAWLGLALLAVISTFLQIDFIGSTRLKWVQATALSEKTGLANQISVDGVYAKYTNAKKANDYSGAISKEPPEDFRCFVQKYVSDEPSAISETLETADALLQKYIPNPRIYESRKKQGLPRIKNNLDKLILNEEYFSPMYLIIGKRTFVGAWCLDKGL